MESGPVGLGTILLLALLPAAGNLIGALLAEWRRPAQWLIGGAMHAAAGLGMGVAVIELIPRAQDRVEPWMLAGALLVGAIAAATLAMWSRKVRGLVSPEAGRATTWGAYAAVGVDLLSDGMMIGSGGAVAAELGVLLALSQVVGNLPGGFAIAANFQRAGLAKAKRWWAMAVYPLIPLLAATISYFAIQGADVLLTGLVLGAFGGLLLTATIEDIIPEADQPGAPRHISTPAFAAGFAALLLMSAYL